MTDFFVQLVVISIHALREEGDFLLPLVWCPCDGISIHALREEGDGTIRQQKSHRCNFYPRPPRGGRRILIGCPAHFFLFLSTPSARRATYTPTSIHTGQTRNFYPRPPRGGRLKPTVLQLIEQAISIHALREEGDRLRMPACGKLPLFLSTPSARRATPYRLFRYPDHLHFYPRPPRGGRLFLPGVFLLIDFISIHALREEGDLGHNVKGLICGISIHALREEGDVLQMQSRWN